MVFLTSACLRCSYMARPLHFPSNSRYCPKTKDIALFSKRLLSTFSMPDTALRRETVTGRRTEGTDDASTVDKILQQPEQARG